MLRGLRPLHPASWGLTPPHPFSDCAPHPFVWLHPTNCPYDKQNPGAQCSGILFCYSPVARKFRMRVGVTLNLPL